MKNNKKKLPYDEPSMETVMLNGFDIVTSSPTSGEPEDGWGGNTPSGGWV